MIKLDNIARISIIILNWNTPEDTIKCVESILCNTTYDAYEIILIDNGSEKERKEELEKHTGVLPDSVRIIYLPENIGFAAGCNYGASVATGEYFEFLNSDTTVERNWLSEKFKTFSHEPYVGGVTSRLFENSNFVYTDQKQYLKTLHGASMMISRSAWERVGEFDEKNFSPFCSEELDWSYRARSMGYKLLLSPKSIVYHHGSQSIKNYAENKKTLFIRLRNRMRHRLFNYSVDDCLDKKEVKQVLREFYHAGRDGYLVLLLKAWLINIYHIGNVLNEREARRKKRSKYKVHWGR